MEEIIRKSVFLYLFLAIFVGVILIQICFYVVEKTRIFENSKIRTAVSITICGAVFCFWLFFFIVRELYPISLACYECKNEVTNESIGVIETIEQEGKDRVRLVINGKEYTLVYNSSKPFVNIGKDIVEGDSVKISFGEKSKYIFDIYEIDFVP